MHPHLFALPWGGFANAYGTLILLGGAATLQFLRWDTRNRGIAPGRRTSFIVDFYLVLAVGAFVGGRLVHILTVPGVYASDPGKLLSMSDSGFVFFGSLLGIAAGWAWVARRYRVAVGTVWDMGLTWMGLAHAFGRLGCFMAGCCWGGPHTGGGGVRFGADAVVVRTGGAQLVGRGDALTTLPLHPTQLYEATGLVLIWLVLWAHRVSKGPEAPWRMASRYAFAYGCLRAGVEVFRGDTSRGYVFELTAAPLTRALSLPPGHLVALSISQAIALALVGIGLAGLLLTRKR